MKRLLLIFLALLLVGSANALPLFGPHQGFRNPGPVELGSLTVGGVDINGGVVSYDDLRAEMYVNETAINSSIDALTLAVYTNETAINSSISALTLAAYTNETAINATIAAMPGSIIDTDYGLSNASGEIRVDIVADKGLEFSSGNLQIEAGDGIDLSSAGLAVDATDIINTGEGLYESTENNIAVNLTEDGGLGFGLGADLGALIIYPYDGLKTTSNGLELNFTADKGLEIGTGADAGALQIELDGSTLTAGASGLRLSSTLESTINNLGAGQIAQNATISILEAVDTAINSSITTNKQSDYVNQTAINSSIGALVVPLATFPYSASSVDQGVFTASGGWTLTAVKLTPRVLGTSESAVSVMVKICDSGEAPASGDNMLSGTLDLKGTADTPQSGTVSSGSIANGKIVALDFTGDLTAAVGVVTLYGTRA